ncbi:eCIS core domain-containing protein [Anthocerotibacter panamensis]|uniref:eCIS core domain-containing protein n=1 Tax=Anthocerotibacter panamensis TaxID=2857077 RepID=UPI001C401C71|nr:DUF4157 domain-containing protein [Anthocerotibacter panamensis]
MVFSRIPKPSSTHIPQPPQTSWLTPPVVQAQPEDGQVMPKMTSAADWWRSSGLVHEAGLAGLQFKLTIGQPGDPYEQEADRVAEQVVGMSAPATPTIQRMCATCAQEEQVVQQQSLTPSITPLVQKNTRSEEAEESLQAQHIQRQTVSEQEETVQRTSAPDLESRLSASKSGGSALSEQERAFMEPRFGVDFSQVRVHSGGAAVQMNQQLHARAFTHGQDIYFGAGQSPSDYKLLAHELTHVVQQTGGVQAKNLIQRQDTGDCSAGEHRQLQNDVNEKCKNRPRGCSPGDSLADVEQKIQNNAECISARERINHRCYQGGDPGHQEAVQVAVNTLIRCQAVRERLRSSAGTPQSAPIDTTSFLERMSQITGLTGAALITYLIVSEGSRLFPPRNLIPVP